MLFHILHLGIFTHKESVDAVVLRIAAAAVIYAAACYDDHVAVLAYEEVVVDSLLKAALADYYGDVQALIFGAVYYADIQPRAV